MPTDTKHDPYKPPQPAIPGVPAAKPAEKKLAAPVQQKPHSAPVAAAAREPQGSQTAAIVACLVAFLVIAGGVIGWKMRQPAASSPTAAAASTEAQTATTDTPASAAALPVGPGAIATTDELSKPWSSKQFLYRDDLLARTEPAMVVRLPGNAYWGFSLVEPFGNCKLEYETNFEKLRTAYDFNSDHPMVVDPCNHAVFDLLQYGGSSSAQVRGALVHGMGVRPPIAIEIEQHGNEIRAGRIE